VGDMTGILGRLQRRLSLWRRHQGGAAAVEFGLVAPMLLAVLLSVVEGGVLMLKYNSMRTGVTSGAQYVMGGGTDLDTTRAITLSAWAGRSNGSSASASKVCRCAGAASSCSTLCADQSVPQAFITVTASDRMNDGIINQTLTARQEIRIR
jgi:Flp pilus assembly protein TadG